jgi:hypothetical protein
MQGPYLCAASSKPFDDFAAELDGKRRSGDVGASDRIPRTGWRWHG